MKNKILFFHFFSCRFWKRFLVWSPLARKKQERVWISCEHFWETFSGENERDEELPGTTMERASLPGRIQWIAKARHSLFSLVFMCFWHFFSAFLQRIALEIGSRSLPFSRTTFRNISECGDCVTLLTSRLWTRNVRSCGNDYQPRSNHRLAPIVLNAGSRRSNLLRPKRNRSRFAFQITSISFG